MDPGCLCLPVCVSLCVISTAQTDRPILTKLSQDVADIYFFSLFKTDDVTAAIFIFFPFRHSRCRNFASISLKIKHKVQSCLPISAVEGQQSQSVTFTNMANRVFEKFKMAAKNTIFRNWVSKVSFQAPLITNLITFCQFDEFLL